MIISLFGWIGTILLAGAGIPQVYKVLKEGNNAGMHWYYLLFIWIGMISMLIYVLFTTMSIQLICSYTFQLIVFSILIYSKKYPKIN